MIGVTVPARYAAHPIDSVVYGDGYSLPEMRAVFGEDNVQRQRLLVEATLAEEQAVLGIIPDEAAKEISTVCRGDEVPLGRIGEILADTQNDIVALTRAAGELMSPLGREYIHFGATSQDIHITGQALVLKEAMTLVEEALARLEAVLVRLSAEHKNTLMVGRTHGQHAIPITFGYKVAMWLHLVHRQRERFPGIREELLTGSVKGAVGTHGVWGAEGIELERAVLTRLELTTSPINIQPSEERYVEYLNWAALVSGLIARICSEVRGLHRTEVGEVREAFATGAQVGSSTMPHKRNAEWSEAMQGIAYKIRSNAQAMLSVLQEHERDGTRNPAEHLLLGESTLLLHKMIVTVGQGLDELEVDTERMRANLDFTGGLIAAETVTFELANRSGQKEHAHSVVYDCAMEAFEKRLRFVDLLAVHPFVAQHLSPDEVQGLVVGSVEQTGTSAIQVEQVLNLVGQTKVNKTRSDR
jgi:adenylosuccinate lyase